jgi:hypothetical protein
VTWIFVWRSAEDVRFNRGVLKGEPRGLSGLGGEAG